MTGIICAMDVEMEKILGMMEGDDVISYSSVDYHVGKIGGKQAVCAICGIGKVAAAICTQTMILKFHTTEIINVGVAGSLSNELAIGDLVIARALVQHDMDARALGVEKGQIVGFEDRLIPTDQDLRDKLLSCAFVLNMGDGGKTVKALTGTIASGDQFISSRGKKQLIAEEYGALACEMEGAAVAQVCHVNHVPFAVLRAISDSADDSARMDFPAFTRMAADNTAVIIKNFFEM